MIPADAPGSGAEPANHSPLLSNPCGPVGATLAHLSFNILGWSSWLLLAGAGRRQRAGRGPAQGARTRGPRVLGFALLAGRLRGHDSQVRPGHQAQPSGGQRRIRRRRRGDIPVRRQFGPYGMLLLMVSAGAFGLVLCHDVLFTWPVAGGRDLGAGAAGPSSGRQGARGRGRLTVSSFPWFQARPSRRCPRCPARRLVPH